MIRLLAAIDEKRGLAKNGLIPWKLPTDSKRYRELMSSKGGNILVGKTTFNQMEGLLDNLNVYVASKSDDNITNAVVIKDIDQFLTEFEDDLWVIGGAGVFAASIGYADELFLTEVGGDFDCDIFFPEYKNDFIEKNRSESFSENGVYFSFVEYARPE